MASIAYRTGRRLGDNRRVFGPFVAPGQPIEKADATIFEPQSAAYSDMNPMDPANETPAVRPLPILRAMIDALDREILQLLSRRNGIVAEIAQFKREHRLDIRDHQREQELLGDRRRRAQQLGLSPELIESLFRLVLWASRDRQASLKAELPADVEPRSVAVIGGEGAMGRCLVEMFSDLGHTVMVADLNTRLTPAEAAAVADVVVISVPIDVTEQVVRELGPLVRADALLMDVTSVKTEPLRAMMEASTASVVGTHPLFGPSVHSLQGQRIVLTPGRGDEWLAWLRRMLHARGLNILETTPDEHDQAMSIVQVLVHFSTEVLGRTLVELGVSLERTLAFTSPIYLLELLMTARHFGQSPELYGAIQMSNPRRDEVTGAFVASAERLREIAAGGDRAAFAEVYRQVREFFGSFTGRALAESDYLIDRLVERA
ncbi:MAG: bifunctional chorismate mutase/prephenate dehydrogenase [Phycisphaerae bacterium]|jgi:chorismate mutase/prephenate dehydrogenase